MTRISIAPSRRPGFTLAELLVVVAIISIIAAALLVAVAGARESAYKARTQAIVANINEFIMQRWDTYASRPIPAFNSYNPSVPQLERLDAMRELIRMEMPERFSDIRRPPPSPLPANYVPQPTNRVLVTPPALSRRYLRRFATEPSPEHEPAECLYLLLESMVEGGDTALDNFTSSEIGDVDGDGFPEILDGWGNPIYWLRWAPAYLSSVQYGPPRPPLAPNDPKYAPDPIDYLELHHLLRDNDPLNDTFALFPLVYSAGADGEYGIFTETDPTTPFQYRTTTPRPNDPYDPFGNGTPSPFGARIPGGGSDDNIDNHFSLNE